MTSTVLFRWTQKGSGVYLAGSWNHFTPEPMIKVTSGRPYELSVNLKPGVYQYLFVVDGKWEFDKNVESIKNDVGGFNNVLLVEKNLGEKVSEKKQQKVKHGDQKKENVEKGVQTNKQTNKQEKGGQTNKQTNNQTNRQQKVEHGDQKKENVEQQEKKGEVQTNKQPNKQTEAKPVNSNSSGSSHEHILDLLAQHNIIPHKDHKIDLTAKRPLGHTTHNLFVKDTKSKQLYLISVLQSVNTDMKEVASKLKAKTLRFASPEDVKSTFGIERGCITSLSLLADKQNSVISVMDQNIFKQEIVTICSGCNDPLDHSQHNVVDVPSDILLKLLQESGHNPKPF